jgi:hypothetical protein
MCYFVVTATNSKGQSSGFSNEASKLMGLLELPGTVDDTTITWQESAAVTMLFDATAAKLSLSEASFNWLHTPVSDPQGIIVGVLHTVNFDNSDDVTSVTYGGEPMIEATGSPLHLIGGAEESTVYIYYLGSGIPTGPQTVQVNISGSDEYAGASISVTAAGDTTENAVDTSLVATSGANPTATFALGSIESFVVQGWLTGRNSLGQITEFTNWAADAKQERDFGGRCMGLWSYDIVASTDVTIGFTAGDDDYIVFAFALKEVAAAGPPFVTIHSKQENTLLRM